jgi:hypothetical protein
MLLSALRNKHGSQPDVSLRLVRALLNFARLPDLGPGLLAAGSVDTLQVGGWAVAVAVVQHSAKALALVSHQVQHRALQGGRLMVLSADVLLFRWMLPLNVLWSWEESLDSTAGTGLRTFLGTSLLCVLSRPPSLQPYTAVEDMRVADAARGCLLLLGELPDMAAKLALKSSLPEAVAPIMSIPLPRVSSTQCLLLSTYSPMQSPM